MESATVVGAVPAAEDSTPTGGEDIVAGLDGTGQTRHHPASADGPVLASYRAAEVVGDIAAEAVTVAAAVRNAAVAAVRPTPTSPDRGHPTGPDAATHRRHRLDVAGLHSMLAHGFDEAARTEYAVFLADPVMPMFSAELGSDAMVNSDALVGPDAVVSFASPAERGLWRDISLARRMEEALQGRERHFEAAFHSAPMAMLIASMADGHPARFLHVNTALSRLTGYSPSDLLDRGFADLAHPDQRALDAAPGNHGGANAAGSVSPVRRWIHADGSDLWVRVHTAALESSGDGPQQSVCQVEDVTAHLRPDPAQPALSVPDQVTKPTRPAAFVRRDDLLAPGPRPPWDH